MAHVFPVDDAAYITSSEPDRCSRASVTGLSYGWFGFKPSCLQRLNNIVGIVVFFSLANGFQNFSQALVGVVLSTLEKQFDLSSTASSWIASAFEIGPIPVLVVFSYFGDRIHRPRSCAFGMLTAAVSCVLFFIPEFTSPIYRPADTGLTPEDSLCSANKSDLDPCTLESNSDNYESLSYYLPVFIVSRLVLGMGFAPVVTHCVTFMNDCSTKEKFPTYAGIFNSLSIVGPAVAFIGGGLMLSLFVSFYAVGSEEINITPDDSQWIGAWWLPFILAAALNLLNAFPLFGYASDLPGAAEIRKLKVSEAHTAGSKEAENALSSEDQVLEPASFSEYRSLFKQVFTNPTWITLTVFTSCDNFIISGFTAFGPKLFEVLYSLSASFAGLLFGVLLLPAGAVGTILGGLVIEKFKLTCTQIIRIQVALSVFVSLACCLILITCKPIDFAGVSAPYNKSQTGEHYNLTDSCNVGCGCDHVIYEPICDVIDKVQYYSPCHAGCRDMTHSAKGDNRKYFNCSCIPGGIQESLTDPEAVWGTCSGNICPLAVLFLVVFFFVVMAMFFCITTNMTATLRCVTRSQASFAISIQVLIIKILGTVPGPLLYGVAFDAACDLWQSDCGVQGSCLSYHINNLSLYVFFICVGVKIIATISVILAAVFYRPPKIPDSTLDRGICNNNNVSDSSLCHDMEARGNGTVTNNVLMSLADETPTFSPSDKHPGVSNGDHNSYRF